MPYPMPEAGLVIGYSYLWHDQAKRGQIEGSKNRPCAIILTVEDTDGESKVTLVPITHTPPNEPDAALELPAATKHRLGLDDECSWIVLSECNQFVWPGPDLRPISRFDNDQYVYGFLPPKLFEQLKRKLLQQIHRQQLKSVPRKD